MDGPFRWFARYPAHGACAMKRAVGDRLCGAHRVRAAAAAIRRSRAHDREDADDNSWQSRPRHARANQESRSVCHTRQRAGCTLQRAIAASHGHLGLSAVSGASTYPANRDFEGHVGGVRSTAPQRFFFILFIFSPKNFIDFQKEKCDILTKT